MTGENCNGGCFRGRRGHDGHGGHGCNGDCNERLGYNFSFMKRQRISPLLLSYKFGNGKGLAGNLFPSQNREALCSTALVNMTR